MKEDKNSQAYLIADIFLTGYIQYNKDYPDNTGQHDEALHSFSKILHSNTKLVDALTSVTQWLKYLPLQKISMDAMISQCENVINSFHSVDVKKAEGGETRPH